MFKVDVVSAYRRRLSSSKRRVKSSKSTSPPPPPPPSEDDVLLAGNPLVGTGGKSRPSDGGGTREIKGLI